MAACGKASVFAYLKEQFEKSCFLLHILWLQIKEMWFPVWAGWDQLTNYKSPLHHERVLQICVLAGGNSAAADGISTERFMYWDCNQDEDWRIVRNDAFFKKKTTSKVCQISGANNTANELWKPGPFLIKLKMPLSSFLVVPAELNNYCSATIQCSARAEANSLPRVSPKQAALILGEGGLPLVNGNWLTHIKNAVKNFTPHMQPNSVTPNQKG